MCWVNFENGGNLSIFDEYQRLSADYFFIYSILIGMQCVFCCFGIRSPWQSFSQLQFTCLLAIKALSSTFNCTHITAGVNVLGGRFLNAHPTFWHYVNQVIGMLLLSFTVIQIWDLKEMSSYKYNFLLFSFHSMFSLRRHKNFEKQSELR